MKRNVTDAETERYAGRALRSWISGDACSLVDQEMDREETHEGSEASGFRAKGFVFCVRAAGSKLAGHKQCSPTADHKHSLGNENKK